jgi:hypothetical protein
VDKGQRVKIVGGRQGLDQSGTIFWKGANKWGKGERLGVRGDDGETYWVSDEDCEAATGSAPIQEAGDTFAKGDRVLFKNNGQDGRGTVFWIGQSRNGPGQRLGVNDDAGEDAVWLDANRCKALSEDDDQGPPPQQRQDPAPAGRPSDGWAEDDQQPDAFTPSVGMDDIPAPPPMDDDQLDQWAGSDDDEVPPEAW